MTISGKAENSVPRILCIGNCCIDFIFTGVAAFPNPGGAVCATGEFRKAPGGCGLNVARSIGLLGYPVTLITKAGSFSTLKGRQSNSEWLVSTCKGFTDIDLRLIKGNHFETPSAFVKVSPDGLERSFVVYPGGTKSMKLEEIKANLDGVQAEFAVINGIGMLDELHDELRELIDLLKSQHSVKKVAVDTIDMEGFDDARWGQILEPIAASVDYFLPSDRGARDILAFPNPEERDYKKTYEEAAYKLVDMGFGSVCIKCGHRGCNVVANGEDARWLTACKPNVVKDVTGAGDTWCAGFVAALAHDRDMGITGAADTANAIASLCIEEVGATTALEKNYKDPKNNLANVTSRRAGPRMERLE